MESWCRTIGGCDEGQETLANLKLDIDKMKKKEKFLSQKLKELQTVAKRIEMMVPYDLNTIIDRKMFDAIPHVIYNPTQKTAGSGVQFSDIQMDRSIPLVPFDGNKKAN